MSRIFNLLSLMAIASSSFAQVGVNTVTPAAALDVTSTTNGVLISRVALTSTTDAATVINPQGGALVASTLVYNTATAGVSPNNVVPGYYYWDGAKWVGLSSTRNWTVNGNSGITTPANPVTYGTSPIGATENYLGTTDGNGVIIGTQNIERMRVTPGGAVGIGTATPAAKLNVVMANSASPAVYAQNTNIASSDGYGVRGISVNSPGWRYGSLFEGGYMGMRALGNGTSNIGNTYGVYGEATGTAGTRIGGYFTATGGTNNYGLIVPPGGGRVGIGNNAPTYRLHTTEPTAAATSIFGENTYVGTSDGRGVSGFSVNAPGYGYGIYGEGGYMGVRGIATSGSYTGTSYGVYGSAGGSAGTRIGGYFAASGGTTNYALQAAGKVRINDGSQGVGKVLTSDALGVATWDDVAINNVVGVLSSGGATIAYNTGPYVQTGSYIILPPGKYAVNVTMLMSKASLTYSPNNSFFWVRSTFSNSGGINPTPSPDIVGSNLCSGNFPGTSVYSLLSGTVIINNTSATNRTYYYVAGSVVSTNTTESLSFFGSSYWAEDNIIAYRLN